MIISSHCNLKFCDASCVLAVGEKTIFAGSSCFDLVTSDGLATSIISGHFDRKVRFWDTRLEKGVNEISLQGKVTSLDIAAGEATCELSDNLCVFNLINLN